MSASENPPISEPPLIFGYRPNISGAFAMNGFKSEAESSASGALIVGQTTMRVGMQQLENGTAAGIELNANFVSSVYSGSSTVQPASAQVLIIIKV